MPRAALAAPLSPFTAALLVALAGGCGAPPPPTGATSAALGMAWPTAQAFPSFAPPAALDVIGSSGRPADVATLLTTLQGTVNRTQPRIYVSDGGAGDQLWLSELGVPTTAVDDPLALVAKYAGELAGLIITDDAQPDTINLATTLAGPRGAVVASPRLAATLGAPPYGLPVVADLRSNHFAGKLAVYQYELDHCAAEATHRLIVGLTPAIAGNLRDYAVATRALTVWLDPRNPAEGALLDRFLSLLPPNSPYLGWWADEPSGVHAAATHGVPVYAADWSSNLTVLGGSPRGSAAVPPAPSPPPLENKVYVAIFMSDGDNLQEDQHLVPLKWRDQSRGAVPIGWTIDPALVDVAPAILRYFQRTATINDVLVSGPSGLGYTYPSAWPAGAFESYARLSGAYLGAAGLRVITVWNNGVDLADADASAYARDVPGLAGLTIQDASQPLRFIDGWLPLVRLALSYGDNESILEGGIDGQLAGWDGAAPRFVAVQGNMNSGAIDPGAFARVQAHYAANRNVVFVRPDHFFSLLARANHPPQHRVFDGDFDGDGKTDQLMYYGGDGNWWLGRSDGTSLSWRLAGNSAGFGNLLDGRHALYTGDFNGDGRKDVLFYFAGDGNWWLGLSDGSTLSWRGAGNSRGFGDLLDGRHRVVVGDYDGDGKSDVMFYNAGDDNWWIGRCDGSTLAWRGAGNSRGFGHLLDGSHTLFDGDFDGDGKADVLFYYAGDGNWWLGHGDGFRFTWRAVGNSAGFGDVGDASHRILDGDFDGDGRRDLLFHFAGDGNWWLGRLDGNGLGWSLVGTTSGRGDLLDWGHRIFTGDFDGDGARDVATYDSQSGDWWIGRLDGGRLGWSFAGNSAGFGDLVDPSRRLALGDFDGDGAEEPLFYYSGDGNWWMARSDGSRLAWHFAGNSAGFGDLTR